MQSTYHIWSISSITLISMPYGIILSFLEQLYSQMDKNKHHNSPGPSYKAKFKDLKNGIISMTPQNNQKITDTPIAFASSELSPQSASMKLTHPSLKLNHKMYSKGRKVDDDSSRRRLNLKDYMHLNSIEKKAKSKSFSKRIKTQTSIASTYNKGPDSAQLPLKQEEVDQFCCEVLKQEIQAKLKEQIKKLQQLAMFLRQDYEEKPNEKQSQFFLFDILKGIDKTSEVTKAVGDKVFEYQGEQRRGYATYYWRREKKVLHSPAKMNSGLEMTWGTLDLFSKIQKNQ